MTDLRIEAWKPKTQRGGSVTVRGWLLILLVAASLFSNAWQYTHRNVVLNITFGGSSLNRHERPPAPNPPIHTQSKGVPIKLVPSEPSLRLFNTMNEAALYALQDAYHDSHYYEVGGVITRVGDKFAVGAPRTDWSGDSVEIDDDPADYHGVIVASYHTHPCNPTSHVPALFSPNDLRSDRSLGHTGYMADLCTGIVTMYDPLTDVVPVVTRIVGWSGHMVGQFHVDGVALDADSEELE
jgi:hypothetical protein